MSKLHKIVATTAFVGTVAVGASQIADADNYTVKDGDTLWDIAVNNGTTVDALMQDNNLTSTLIRPGDQLTYSSSVERLAQAKNDGYYTITLGDTLGSVASKFGTTVDSLVELNNLSDPNMVYVGQVIKVDAKASGEVVTAQAAPVQAAPVQAAPVAQTRVVAAPVAQTRVVAAPAAQTKAAVAPAAQTKAAAAPAAQTKAAVAPAAQTKAAVAPVAQTRAVAAPAAQTKAAVAPAAQTKAVVAPKAETKVATPAPAAQTKAAVAPAAQTKAATPAPAAQTKAATPAPAAQTKAATPAPAAQTKAAVAPKAETKAATPAPAAQTKAAVAPKAETKAATPAPAAQTKAAVAPKAETKAATPAPAAQTKAATPATQTKAAATPAASGSKNAAIYQAALAQVGRYQDCTMLVTNALKSVGINYHDWPAGYMKLGTQVSASQAQAGDLIYYANGGTGLAHIAVYAGNGQAVHGGWLGNQTVVNSANVGSGQVYIRVK